MAGETTRFKKGHKKVGGKKKGYKSMNTYLHKILQKKPIKQVISDLETLGISSKTNIELLAWKKFLIAMGKNPHTSLAAIKDIEERMDGKVTSNINANLNIDLDNLTKEELEDIVNGKYPL